MHGDGHRKKKGKGDKNNKKPAKSYLILNTSPLKTDEQPNLDKIKLAHDKVSYFIEVLLYTNIPFHSLSTKKDE